MCNRWLPNKLFKDSMKAAIDNSTDPMDANLETVLPGVHQWHQATNQSIKATSNAIYALDEKFDSFTDCLNEGLSRVVHHLDGHRQASDRKLAETFLNIAQDLLNCSSQQDLSSAATPAQPIRGKGNAGGVTGTSLITPYRLTPEEELQGSPYAPRTGDCSLTTPGDANNTVLLEDSSNYRMVKKHKSLSDMWDEWHGAGQFTDAVGGIKGRNKQFGAKWRRHLEVQHYSRTKLVVLAISNFANANKLKIEEACAIMDEWYVQPPVSLSLTKMKQLCIDKGILSKGKQRGKQCRKQQSAQDETMEDGGQ